MKKISILISSASVENALKALRKEGVVHVKHVNIPRSENIDELKNKIAVVDEAINLTSVYKHKEAKITDSVEIFAVAQNTRDLNSKIKELIVRKQEAEECVQKYQPWGNCSVKDVELLSEESIYTKLYSCKKNELKKISSDKYFNVIQVIKGVAYLVFVTKNENESLPFNEIKLPQKDLRILEEEIDNISNEIEFSEKEIKKKAVYNKALCAYKNELEHILEFQNVSAGMGRTEGVSYLSGFCPENLIGNLENLCENNKWYLLIEDVEEDQEVPTLLKNPLLGRLSGPIFDFMNTLPGYREFDISIVFMIFFSLFFAMLIGDAGYGIIFLLITFFVRMKFKKAPKEPFVLFYTLSLGAIVWGAVTGTWFGAEKAAALPFFNALIIDKLYSFKDVNQNFIIKICFTIGLIHLTIAHSIVAFGLINSLKALGHIGWIMILWGLYFFAGNLVLGEALPAFALYLVLFGFLMVVFFVNYEKKNYLKSMLGGLINLPLSVISSFSDIVSYIRLFAVGYASVTVAKSFNEIAASFGLGSFTSGLIFALILVFGHGLNIALGAMAVVVHGIRLNMLEFSSHMGMQWSGIKYRPFKK